MKVEEDVKQAEFLSYVMPILLSAEYQKRKSFPHHGDTSVYTHSINVAYKAFQMAKKARVDTKTTAIAGMLHDFYLEPWKKEPAPYINVKTPKEQMHGYTHGPEAARNAYHHFPQLMTPKIAECISTHMFPLVVPGSIQLPNGMRVDYKKLSIFKEGRILCMADKLVSSEVIKLFYQSPTELPPFIGIPPTKYLPNDKALLTKMKQLLNLLCEYQEALKGTNKNTGGKEKNASLFAKISELENGNINKFFTTLENEKVDAGYIDYLRQEAAKNCFACDFTDAGNEIANNIKTVSRHR